MSRIDAKVASILDRPNNAIDSDDEDALIASLEEDDDHAFSALREQRIQQLHSEFSRAKQMKESGSGTFTEIKDEKALMDITTSTKYAVVHFFKTDFGRCGIMDRHLDTLAPKHFDTRFLRINVDNAPFLVTKLKVQVLPCVIGFIDGIGVDRIVGFEGLGNGDSFTTKDLEARLLAAGVLVRAKVTASDRLAIKKIQDKEEDFSDDEWD
ncbi:putative gtpase inhibitor [Venturia nashicola]|uniref:Putative gtpase inhibitor n=1 Tax=Venturia nashicola TaxID=86259 RepID=A0A4Z1PCP4_9PEZI|nr:putative gtpase inhibitor [Venturia nashicola]TLD30054.1 putative gtpase inhibitor [Venturia nashicola]